MSKCVWKYELISSINLTSLSQTNVDKAINEPLHATKLFDYIHLGFSILSVLLSPWLSVLSLLLSGSVFFYIYTNTQKRHHFPTDHFHVDEESDDSGNRVLCAQCEVNISSFLVEKKIISFWMTFVEYNQKLTLVFRDEMLTRWKRTTHQEYKVYSLFFFFAIRKHGLLFFINLFFL